MNIEDKPPKPYVLLPRFANIPEAFRLRRAWVVWAYVWRNGKWNKVPFRVSNPRRLAASDNPETQDTFDAAVAIYSNQPKGCDLDGIGMCREDGEIFIDADGCLDENGKPLTWVAPYWEAFNSIGGYSEISVSGTGLHKIAMVSGLPGTRVDWKYNKQDHVGFSFFAGHRFFTFTGVLWNSSDGSADQTEAVARLYRQLFPVSASRNGHGSGKSTPNTPSVVGDEDVLVVAMRDPVFRRLFNGDASGYPSPSEADLALCNKLAFYFGRDPVRMDAIFRRSGLMRGDKWGVREDYRTDTMQKAIDDTHEMYKPRRSHEYNKYNKPVMAALDEVPPSGPEDAEKKDSDTPDLIYFLHNDYGNSLRLIALHGDDMRFCHAFRKWLVWTGKRWDVDETGRAQRRAKRTMLAFLDQGIERNNEAAQKFAKESLERKAITNMLGMAESEIFVTPEELDRDPFLLNFKNGTVDLRTGELRSHRREDFITKLIHHRYNPDARCPRWLSFLYEIMCAGPDQENLERAQRLTDYLQRALGYSLTGCTIEKAVFIPFGSGDNGKSTLLSTFRQLVEEYSVLLQVDTLMVREESNNTQADKADLRGARFAQTSEVEEGQRLAQGKLKQITQGMGKIKAVRKYENPIEFNESHKLWMDTNRKPTIRDVDDKATFNRLHPIPFTVQIAKEKIDKNLPSKLLAEAEGILGWAIRGAKLWHETGLNKPVEVEAAKDEWRSEMDTIGRFIEDRCETGDGFTAQASTLYSEYKLWAESNGERAVTGTFFGRKIADRYPKRHGVKGWLYEGIGLKYRSNPSGLTG